MPGILPMKVIKVGANAQSRIAQACDRCRSKKIRCDGIRPCCSQCANVGFECKTSDKLSRRAFPRGYTESLEERVRCLEAEVRELKELLDEKDEKIDMLSRMHSNSPLQAATPRRTSLTFSPQPGVDDKEEIQIAKDDLFKVQQSPFLLEGDESDGYFMGTSSGRAFIDAFKRKLQEGGKPYSDFDAEAFYASERRALASPRPSQGCEVIWRAPPRLVSDQMVNIFFQEWAPLFPVLHRPTFLALYEDYVASPDTMEDKKSLAQLHLVFGIAALSTNGQSFEDVTSFETQWQAALEAIMMDNSLSTLQCLVLAQIHCIQKADYTRLLNYKGLAIGLSQRLGLHQPQKRFALGALTGETRKKVFWSLYTLDCFSAALLGLPKHLKEEDIDCEYPADADDEYVTEKGFLPSLPGEYTKLSSGLALFRASRILSKVLEENYPASASHEISLRKLGALGDDLDEWWNTLAPHLKLVFSQDKPSTNVTSSRSPLLSLIYHYIRTLIHRPAVCANLGHKSSSSVLTLAASSKHIIQIIQLLDERNLSFSLCLNRNELISLSGFGLLFQGLDLDQDGKLIKDSQRLVCSVIEMLERSSAPGAQEFRRIGCSLISVRRPPSVPSRPSLSRHNSEGGVIAQRATDVTINRLQPTSSTDELSLISGSTKESRRATAPTISLSGLGLRHNNHSQSSLSSEQFLHPRSEPSLSPSQHRHSVSNFIRPKRLPVTVPPLTATTNLDYLSFDSAPASNTKSSRSSMEKYTHQGPLVKVSASPASEWEKLLGSIDNGQTNIYDNIYGGPPVESLLTTRPYSSHNHASCYSLPWLHIAGLSATSLPASTSAACDYLGFDSKHSTWTPEIWQYATSVSGATLPTAQSRLSFSDESLTSGEEFSSEGGGSADGSSAFNAADAFKGIMMPCLSPQVGAVGGVEDDGLGLEGNFVL